MLRQRPEARFVSVGHRAAADYVDEFGPERAIAYPGAWLREGRERLLR